jgi:hypothetical protein
LTLPKTETYTHSMTGRRLIEAVVVVLTVVLLWAPAPRAQAVPHSMYVSVLNDDGAPVPDLGPADFVIREDNLAREILSVGPVTTPMSVALLVDTSQASRNNTRDIREAASNFIKAVTGGDIKNQVALIGVGERPTVLTDYSTDQAKPSRASASFSRTTAAGRIFWMASSRRRAASRSARQPAR